MEEFPAEINASIVKVGNAAHIERPWRSLEDRCRPSFFLTWAWIGPWVQLAAKETDLYLFTVNKNDATIALCFLTLCNVKRLKGVITVKQVQLNEYLAKGFNMVIQYNGILAEPDNQHMVWKLLFKTLNNWNISWDEVALSSLKKSGLDDAIYATPDYYYRIDKEHSIWRVLLDNDCNNIDTLLKIFKSKSRQQLRQSLNTFEAEYGEITYTVPDSLEQALSYFKHMGLFHTRRWVQAGKAGSFANKNWVEFHENVITKGFPRGEIFLMEIRSASLILGYLYGHIYSDTVYMQQTGFIVTHDNKLRPGYISHLQAMIFSAKKGMKYYDILPDEKGSYKKFFTAAGDSVYWLRIQRPRIKFFIEESVMQFFSYLRSVTNQGSNN